jgi:hypothetical protein
MRQRTNWEFNALASKGTYIRAGRVHSPKWDCKADIIRLEMRSLHNFNDMHMTVDEAVVISAALMKVVAREMWNRGLDVRERYEKPVT